MVFFGQLKYILMIELPENTQLGLESPNTVICTVIHNVKAELQGQLYYYEDLGQLKVIDLNSVKCVVGRVYTEDQWGVVDQSTMTVYQTDQIKGTILIFLQIIIVLLNTLCFVTFS